MPIYEFECEKCGERFELHRNMADSDREVRCPKCGAEKPQRVFSVFGKGSSSMACPPSSPT
ncbi:unnamed protein product [marine sediment metagenome]|uniref:Putative regulatory protein FmdB zinc ribbon domain-containing protein n=1 Tax=marine sediment metagenome TaxID=412755 RepID=X1N121_9ZZZZ